MSPRATETPQLKKEDREKEKKAIKGNISIKHVVVMNWKLNVSFAARFGDSRKREMMRLQCCQDGKNANEYDWIT